MINQACPRSTEPSSQLFPPQCIRVQFLHILTSPCYFQVGFCLFVTMLLATLLDVKSGFDLHFPNNKLMMLKFFHVLIDHLYIFFGGRNIYLSLLPIFN